MKNYILTTENVAILWDKDTLIEEAKKDDWLEAENLQRENRGKEPLTFDEFIDTFKEADLDEFSQEAIDMCEENGYVNVEYDDDGEKLIPIK